MYSENEYKTVVLLNKKKPLWMVLNGAFHATLGLGSISSTEIDFLNYTNADGENTSVSRYPVIVLRARNIDLLKVYKESSLIADVKIQYFIEEMISSSSEKQIEATASSSLDSAEILAVSLFGKSTEIDHVISKLSTVRDTW